MRKIEYIFIDSDCATSNRKSGHRAIPNLGYHFVVNSEGLVLNPTGISIPAHIIRGPVYDPDKYNDCSIFIRYCGSISPEAWLMQSGNSCSTIMAEIDGKELHSRNIIVSDAMNVLRRELSDLP